MILQRRNPRNILVVFCRNRRGASAVEFAILAFPLFMLLLAVIQIGLFYVAQSALDTGVINTADMLRNNFTTGSSAMLPPAATLKSNVATGSGGMIQSANLAVEIRQFSTLSAAVTSIVDGTVDYGSTRSTLILRAQATVPTLAPGLSGLSTIRSSAMIRRQGT